MGSDYQPPQPVLLEHRMRRMKVGLPSSANPKMPAWQPLGCGTVGDDAPLPTDSDRQLLYRGIFATLNDSKQLVLASCAQHVLPGKV
jgi:hypothetical protein